MQMATIWGEIILVFCDKNVVAMVAESHLTLTQVKDHHGEGG